MKNDEKIERPNQAQFEKDSNRSDSYGAPNGRRLKEVGCKNNGFVYYNGIFRDNQIRSRRRNRQTFRCYTETCANGINSQATAKRREGFLQGPVAFGHHFIKLTQQTFWVSLSVLRIYTYHFKIIINQNPKTLFWALNSNLGSEYLRALWNFEKLNFKNIGENHILIGAAK